MNRSDIETKVTDGIIAALEAGTTPWRKPWRGAENAVPRSVATGKPYRGINWLVLELAYLDGEYERNLWLTYKQAQALGGNVRKGEKGTTVVFWKVVERVENGEKQSFPLLRTFTVFNVAQTEGVELPKRFAPVEPGEPVEVLDGVRDALAAYVDGPEVTHERGDRAFYRPSTDVITMPELDQFETPLGYAETLFHELVHSTGHETRLDRFEPGSSAFGCEGYAKEELVAEIGAAMLAALVGVELDPAQPASYVASWLRALKDDRSLIIKASQQAQKAVDRILPATAPAARVEEEAAAA